MLKDMIQKQDINKGLVEFQATNDAVLLDVRTKDEYQSGHVPGSKNIDVGLIDAAISLIDDKYTPIFVYCYSGARSSKAVSALKKMGYMDVRSIGGISSYTGTVEKGA